MQIGESDIYILHWNMTDWPVNLFLLCSSINLCIVCSPGFLTILTRASEWTSFYDLFYCRASGHRQSSRAFGLYLLLHSDFHPLPTFSSSFFSTSKPPNQPPSHSEILPRKTLPCPKTQRHQVCFCISTNFLLSNQTISCSSSKTHQVCFFSSTMFARLQIMLK